VVSCPEILQVFVVVVVIIPHSQCHVNHTSIKSPQTQIKEHQRDRDTNIDKTATYFDVWYTRKGLFVRKFYWCWCHPLDARQQYFETPKLKNHSP